ncbi:MAG: MMPL family transporter [Lachnospiraceae bacterium]|nr:MMPL family transporter [Lachnospiraceae bacterium]
METEKTLQTSSSKESKKDSGNSAMVKVATFIVDRRNLFFLLFGIAIVFCLIAANWVKVENDLAAFLPGTAETTIGLDLMEDQFVTYGTADVMVMNVTLDEAKNIAEGLESRKDIYMISFDESESHFNNLSALYNITFTYPEDDPRALESLEDIKKQLEGYDICVTTSMGDQTAELINKEMNVVSILVAIVVVTVLIFTSQTYAEVPVLLLTFGAGALLASGTNYLLGTISFVSDSVTIVLQLALSVDYAIIFCNRYKEEHESLPIREADIIALSKAIPEICASSLTTIGGLIAMLFMKFKIGPDMAVCLIKAIFLSLLSVFLLMPGLLMLFGPLMDKTKHKSFVPKIPFVGKFDYYSRFIVAPLFVVLIVGAYLIQKDCPIVYGDSMIDTPIQNDVQIANAQIAESFGKSNFVALVVPAGSYETEKKLLSDLEKRPEVDHTQGLANTEAMDGYMLTDALTAREFSELMDVDYEMAELLYMAYAVNDENYAKIINGFSGYKIALIDSVMFLYEEVKQGYVTLDPDLEETLTDANSKMQMAKDQLQGQDYSRMLVYLTLPEEGDETFAFLDEMHDIAGQYYDKNKVYVIGNATSEYDLKKSYEVDSTVTSVISILAVLVVLLFTFMSAGMPVLLILVIQGAIWLNFAFPAVEHTNLFFLGYMIVSSIQMGANIDYAIVISGRYTEVRKVLPKKEAIVETMNFAFPTIITSGSMMVLAGFAIGRLTSNGVICGIGQSLGRGTVISIVLVMFVLPQILMVGERVIEKTSFKMSTPIKLDRGFGTMRVDGFVRGQVNGVVIGEMHAIVKGEVNAIVSMGEMQKIEKEAGEEGLGDAE